MSDVSRIDPDNILHDQTLLDRPGNMDIQLDLFHDYGLNVPLYPKFQAFFRERKPPTLIVWERTTSSSRWMARVRICVTCRMPSFI